MGNFLENLFAKRNAKDNSAQIAQQMQPLVQKANVRNVQNLQAGRINRDQYQKQSNNILGAWQDNSVKQLDNGLVVNTKKNNGFETALTGLSSGIMSIAPQRIAGSIAEYGGTVLGNDKIRDFGRKLDQPFRDYGAVQNEQASNKLLYGGANLAGSLLTLPIAPTKGATAFRAVQYGAPQAADTASAIRDGGGGRVAQILGGGVTGAISGTLGVKGAESILNPKDQLAKTLAGRVFKAGNYEGLENAVQSGVDSLVAKNTYNKDLSLGQAAKDALTQYGMGFAGGGLVRGGMEVAQAGNRPRVPLTPELQNKRDILAERYTKSMQMGRPDLAAYHANEISKIDNPPKGSLREKIRSAKNTVVEAYKKEMLLPGEPGAKKQGGFIGSGDTNPLESLKQEARKYKSAEEFADSLNAMKYGKVTGVGQLPVSKINKTQIKALTERGLPHTDTNLKVSDFKPGRQVTQPLEVYSKGGSWVVENGNHRLAQALANGDETVPVVFKGGEGKKYSTPITDLYNQAHAEATQTPQAPKVEAPTGAPIEKTPQVGKPDPTEALKQEALKYKSAEEFVKAQGTPVYHGGTEIKEVGNMRSKWGAFYMTDNPTYAKSYGGNKSFLNEMVITPEAKLADLRKPSSDIVKQIEDIISPKKTGKTFKIQKPDGSFIEVPETKGDLSNPVHSSADIIQGIKDGKAYYAEMPEVKEALKKLGYDGQITSEVPYAKNIGVWNKEVIKTKSQLTDLYNQATQSQPPKSPLKTETLYHGSDRSIDKFNVGEGMQGRGVYLTNDTNRATMYGSRGADGVERTPVVNTVKANIKNPLISSKVYTRDMFGDTGDVQLNKMLDTAFDAYGGKLDGENLGIQLRVGQDNSNLEKLGFDAYKSSQDTVVFDPKNVEVIKPAKSQSPLTPNNQRTIDSYSTPKPVTEYKVGEKVSVATAQGGEVNGTITKTPDFSKDLRIKGNNFSVKLEDGTIRKTDGAGFGEVQSPLTVEKNIDPVKKAELDTNIGLEQLSDIRKQYSSDQEFFDKVILENVEAPGKIGEFARYIANRDAREGSIYNKNYLTEILDDELAPINSKLDQAVNKTAQREDLARSIRDLEKSTGQKGLYQKVAQEMKGMSEAEQVDFMGKAMKSMRDNGVLAMDYVNRQNGYTPKASTKPTLQDALEGKSAKPFTPISQPVDNIPDFAKRVVDSQAKTKTQSKKQQSAVLSQEVSNNQPLAVSSDSNIPPVANDVQSILQGKQVKNKTLQERIATNDRYPQPVKDMLNGTYVAKDNKTTIKDAKNLIRTDRTAAEARALNPQNAVDMAINAELFNHYVDTGNHTKAMEFINSTGDTNLGQMVQILSQYDKTTPQGSVKFAQKAIEKYNKANPNKALSLSETDVKSLVSKAQEVHAMPEGRARNIASQQLITQVNDLIPSTLADKALAVWKAGLLTSPRTTMRNLIGNTVHGITETVKDAPAALNDMLLAGKTGDRSLTFTTKGALSGAKEGFKSGSDMMKFGFDPTQAIDKYDVRHVTWGKNPVEQGLKKYTDFVFHAMGAQDQPFYHSAFARSLYDQAGAQAINAGQRGNKAFIENLVKNPTESMKKIATQDASVATFKDPNILKSMAGQIKNQANKNEITKVISEVVMPFTGVPSSIAGQMAAYSPIGLAKGIVNDARVLSGSKVAGLQRKASQEIGRGIIGTGLMGLGAYLTAQGLMTGNPKDADEAKQWQLEGKQANSVLIGGKWRSINSVGPEALVALAGSKIQAGKQNGDGAGAIAGNLGKDFTSQTFLAGVQGPLQAVSDPARYGGTYTKGMASSIVPNIVKDTSKAFDPTQREVNSVSDALKASLPGFRNTLLPKRDALGNPLKQEPTGAGAFIDLFNSKTPIKNPVVDELSRLYKSGNSATPSTLSKNQTILGEKVKLDPKQLDQLEQSTGQPITQQFNQLMATPEYKGASDEIKKKSLDKIVQDVRDQAKLNLGGGTAGTTNTPNSVVNLSKISSDAQMTLAKDSFDKSGKSYQIIGDTVLRRSADGVISATPKIKFDNQINTATLAKQKASDDLKGWMSTAETQLKNIDSQLADPSIDPLEAIQLQNDAQSLLDNIEKYTKYGGFKKGKSGRKSSAEVARNKLATATLSMNNNTLSSLKSLDALLAGTRTPSSAKAKTVAVRKPTLKQIKVRA